MDGYTYDVFLSYRRCKEWSKFVEDHFLPIFRFWLAEELRAEPKIYYDAESVDIGDPWPYSLAEGLASSKVMVCLWSGQYWSSAWCEKELSQMLARRKSAARNAAPLPLVVAAVLHDCDPIDPSLSDIQLFYLKDVSNPFMIPESPNREKLGEKLRDFASATARAVRRAPDWDPSWPGLTTNEFLELFKKQAFQERPPSFG